MTLKKLVKLTELSEYRNSKLLGSKNTNFISGRRYSNKRDIKINDKQIKDKNKFYRSDKR